MRANADSVYQNIIEKKGYLYVCGEGGRMAKDVHKTLLEIIMEKGQVASASLFPSLSPSHTPSHTHAHTHAQMDEDQAKSIITVLQKQARYQQDVWS
jgi:sulfite reductase alpha subunit-like flavoprotein